MSSLQDLLSNLQSAPLLRAGAEPAPGQGRPVWWEGQFRCCFRDDHRQ